MSLPPTVPGAGSAAGLSVVITVMSAGIHADADPNCRPGEPG